MTEAIIKKSSCLFRRISDFSLPFGQVVLMLHSTASNAAHMARTYDKDGALKDERIAHPGVYNEVGVEPPGVAKISGAVYASHPFEDIGGSLVYKDGAPWIPLEDGYICHGFISSVGGSLWVATTPVNGSRTDIVKFDAETKVELARLIFYRPEFGLSNTTIGAGWDIAFSKTHHAHIRFNGEQKTDDVFNVREWLLLYDANGGSQKIINTFEWSDAGVNLPEMHGVALNSDRLALAWGTYSGQQGILIYDLDGNLKHQITGWGQYAQMLIMSESLLYASNKETGVVRVWKISDDGAGNKTYTFYKDFNTPSPFAWVGSLATSAPPPD